MGLVSCVQRARLVQLIMEHAWIHRRLSLPALLSVCLTLNFIVVVTVLAVLYNNSMPITKLVNVTETSKVEVYKTCLNQTITHTSNTSLCSTLPSSTWVDVETYGFKKVEILCKGRECTAYNVANDSSSEDFLKFLKGLTFVVENITQPVTCTPCP